jgi:hypothetical protein
VIELRWLVPVEGERKLQYRQQIDVTVRAGQWDTASVAQTANWQWSEWRDVPLVAERDPSYP